MSFLKGARARLRAIVRPAATDRELGEEIRFHIDLETQQNIERGMSPAEARRVAMAHFGGVQRVREEHRDVRRVQLVDDFATDARFALRSLRRTPALAGAAILTLALGIGANTAIFSAVNAVVLRPLPVAHPGQLAMLWEENPEKGWYKNVDAAANVLDWKEQVPAFEDVAAYADFLGTSTLTGQGDPRLLKIGRVTGNFFSMLGVHAALGRTLDSSETWARGNTRSVVLSYATWRDQFGANRDLVGKTIRLDGAPVQVVGVMPDGFAFPWEHVDGWLAIGWDPAARGQTYFRRAHWLRAIARVKPGVSFEQANAQLQAVVHRLKRQYPATNRVMGAGMTPLHEFLVGDTRLPLLVLLTAVGLLLLIACANVGNLLLVQAAGREREIALRLALGAGRLRLVRAALAESLVLSTIGGVAGFALGWAGTHVLEGMQPPEMLRVSHFGVDIAVLGYTALIVLVSGMLFGIAPALWARGRDPAEALKDGSRSGTQGRRVRRWGDALVVAEVAIALMLTVGAGLLARSFWGLRHVDPGFDANGVLAVQVSLNRNYDSVSKVTAFWDQLMTRARAIPGVSSAAYVSDVPLSGTSYTSDFIAAGRPADGYGSEVGHRQMSPEYFATMRVPILRGRGFTAEDRRGSLPVIVINEKLARTYFKGQDPIGQRIAFDKVPDSTSKWYTVVGVVGNEHQSALDVDPQIEIFQSTTQSTSGQFFLLLRTAGDPLALSAPVRQIVHELDPSLAIVSSQTMLAVRARSLARARFLTTLLLAFAVVGLVLSIVGVYGLLAQLARNRTREMGIRSALGAPAARLRWLIVSKGLRLTAAGLVVGGVAAMLTTRLMTALLFHVAPNDPAIFATVAVLLAGTSVLASWLPARRASGADPVVALRAD
jgi:putative ABC transport system permease protein